MSDALPRVRRSADLGRAKRPVDLMLGASSMVPLLALAVLAWTVPSSLTEYVRTLAVIWTGALLAFFAGVRRGLTFSEASGGRWSELATMLGLFFWGVASLVCVSPVMAALGLAAVGVLDARAGRKAEAPPYFARFRPVQTALGVVALVLVALRPG